MSLVRVDGPTDPKLRPAWTLAQVKVERRLGRPLGGREDWNAVTAEYGRLVATKRIGIVRCPEPARQP